MKALLVAAILLAAGAARADPVEGVWQTQPDDDGAYAHVTFAPCGAKICATISRSFRNGREYASDNRGKALVWDMRPVGDGSYVEGRIWQPSTGKIYRSKMVLQGNRLSVSGCVGPFCRSQVWSRVR